MKNFNLKNSTAFITIASTLNLIKSKSLLPKLEFTKEEEEDINELKDRLQKYHIIKTVSQNIKNLYKKNEIQFHPFIKDSTPIFVPDKKITINNMYEIIQNLISLLPDKKILKKIEIEKVINIDEVINSLTKRIQDAVKTSFNTFSKRKTKHAKEQKIYTIVSFLAMLELVKTGLLQAIQKERYTDITLMQNNTHNNE